MCEHTSHGSRGGQETTVWYQFSFCLDVGSGSQLPLPGLLVKCLLSHLPLSIAGLLIYVFIVSVHVSPFSRLGAHTRRSEDNFQASAVSFRVGPRNYDGKKKSNRLGVRPLYPLSHPPALFLKTFIYVCFCVCAGACMLVRGDENAWDLLELELHYMWL